MKPMEEQPRSSHDNANTVTIPDPVQESVNLYISRGCGADHNTSINTNRSKKLAARRDAGPYPRCPYRSGTVGGGVQLPHDIHAEILARLPARSVLRFRAVSQAWNATTRDHGFARLHLACQTDRHRGLIIRYPTSPKYLTTTFHLVEMDEQSGGASFRVSELDPLNISGMVVGSCNGLLCFWRSWNGWRDLDIVRVCNPLLGECLTLPDPTTWIYQSHDYSSSAVNASHGFGFDPVRSEFKVVRVSFPGVNNCEGPRLPRSDVEVCTIPINGSPRPWRSLGSVPYVPYQEEFTFHAFVNGKLHWLARADYDYVIVSLDIGDEKIQLVPAGPIKDMNCHVLTIAEVGGLLSVLSNNLGCEGQQPQITLWVMREYGNEDSWTREFSFRSRRISDDENIIYEKTLWTPCIYTNGRFLLQNDQGILMAYDPISDRLRNYDDEDDTGKEDNLVDDEDDDTDDHGNDDDHDDNDDNIFGATASDINVLAYVGSLISLKAGEEDVHEVSTS